MSGNVSLSSVPLRTAAPSAPVVSPAPSTAPAQPDPVAVAVASKRPLVNPSLHFNLALNLVVLQFVDDKGDVTSSFPSDKQIKAYQAHEADRADKPPVQPKQHAPG